MTDQPIPYTARLRAELIEAIAEYATTRARRRRRRRITLALATAVAVLVPIVLAVVLRTGPAVPALAIERDGDAVTVRLIDATADPERMTRELQAAGVDAVVMAVPAPPPLVGHWAGGSIGGRAEGLVWTGDTIVIPADAREVVLHVGRPETSAGDAAVGANPFAPGATLHCSGVEHLPPAAADAELRQRGLIARWQMVDAREVFDDPPGGDLVIVDATVHGREILFALAPRDALQPGTSDIPEQNCGD